VAQYVLRLSTLGDATTAVHTRSKARFVECVFFATAVLLVILSAATPELRLLLFQEGPTRSS
jgi:hypothetical protein